MFTEDCEGEIEIVDLLPFNPVVDSALCRLVMERGVSVDVRDGGGDLSVYTFTTPHLTTIVLENKVCVQNVVLCSLLFHSLLFHSLLFHSIPYDCLHIGIQESIIAAGLQ